MSGSYDGRSEEYSDLFTFIMEADDDIPAFDPGPMDATPAPEGDAIPDQTAPPDNADSGSDDMPPEMNDAGDEGFDNFNADDMGEGGDENETAGEDEADDDEAGSDKLGEKTNDILNARLYEKIIERNGEIETLIEQITRVLVALPYETTKEIDKPINQLKTALARGQQYAIDEFVHAEYGVNLLFYEKLNSVYILLEDKIDKILKKANKDKK